MAAPQKLSSAAIKLKHMVWTGAFAAITITGTIYGAGLKTDVQYRNEVKKAREASPEERIAVLEARRAELARQRFPIEVKLGALRERMKRTKELERQLENKQGAEQGKDGKKS